jgi:alanine dehydrogenase
VPPGNVVILGAGTVGLNALRMAVGLGGDVSVLDVNVDRLRHVDDLYRGQVVTVVSNAFNIARLAPRADLLVGAVLVAGARAPVLVPESMVKTMKEGSVIVDVAVDQGGCVETIKPTTHAEPTYVVDGVVHYGVANMPGAVARTTIANVPGNRKSKAMIIQRFPCRCCRIRSSFQLSVAKNCWSVRGAMS